MSIDKYSMRRSRLLYLSQDKSPPSAVFFAHTSTGSALGGILYFELLLSQYSSRAIVAEQWVLRLVRLNKIGLWVYISWRNFERAKAMHYSKA